MSYLRDSLSSGELILERFSLHWTAWCQVWLMYGLIITIPFGIFLHLKLRSIEYGLTNRRVVLKRGIIGRNTDEMKIGSIETVEIRQSVWGRLTGFGNVEITGIGTSTLVFDRVSNPMAAKRAIEERRHIPAG